MKLEYELHIADSPLGWHRDNVNCQRVTKHIFKIENNFHLEMNIRRLIPNVSIEELNAHVEHLNQGLNGFFLQVF